MKAVFVNHCHPDTPHICATRVREFARAMADRGHEIILLTETLDGNSPNHDATKVADQIKSHDFSTPFNLACPPSGHDFIKLLRLGKLPWGIRQLVIAWYYTFHHGVVTDWRQGCRFYLDAVANEFNPDVIWASFGNTDCWNIARDLAAAANCSWVADIKDPWEIFIPRFFRKKLARKFDDAAAMTCFSNMHKEEADQWFGGSKSIVYSGFKKSVLTEPPPSPSDNLQIMLTGATYDQIFLQHIMTGVLRWADTLNDDEKNRVKFVYAGSDVGPVASVAEGFKKSYRVDLLGYLPIEQLQAIQRKSLVNIYVKSDRTFHHKLIELLAAKKPVLCFPAEIAEAAHIAESVNIPLYSCQTIEDITASINACLRHSTTIYDASEALENLCWENQAVPLENVLLNAIEEYRLD